MQTHDPQSPFIITVHKNVNINRYLDFAKYNIKFRKRIEIDLKIVRKSTRRSGNAPLESLLAVHKNDAEWSHPKMEEQKSPYDCSRV
ncbi:hypothetical protein PoB_005704500 [Plakobranchus ocellatus]|uniref:Uncharacterized protein n=1 Tax=Plakobranchus ocellatus TaxID=259542 RepID=A0AAV4CGA6_9GAST|nr:hypothetical protein PoB_005704500 [Plakobranchus ocellatus]